VVRVCLISTAKVVADVPGIPGYHSDFQTFKSKTFHISLDDLDLWSFQPC
jgi:hypothetical protein